MTHQIENDIASSGQAGTENHRDLEIEVELMLGEYEQSDELANDFARRVVSRCLSYFREFEPSNCQEKGDAVLKRMLKTPPDPKTGKSSKPRAPDGSKDSEGVPKDY